MAKSVQPAINLNLLKPQGSPEKFHVKLVKWLLSTGRFLLVFVEALVLVAFVGRFKLDADQASLKEAVDQRIPFVESLVADERLIRQTQLQLATIRQAQQAYPDFGFILKSLAAQTPGGIKMFSINLDQEVNQVMIKMSGVASTNQDLNTLVVGLKESRTFTNTTLQSVSLEQGVINFSLSANVSNSITTKKL